MKVAGYTRVSAEEQAQEGFGLSAQEQSIRAYCQALDWELVALYTDAGKSGGSRKGRDALAQLIADAKSGCFERVIFHNLDRLGRNLADMLAICGELEAHGVDIVSIQEGFDARTIAGRTMRNLFATFAEFEREMIRERIKAGLAEKARQGQLIGPLPLGYRRGDGTVELDPVTAPLVRELFVRYATGTFSLRDLTPWTAQVGLRSRAGNPLDRLSIRKILANVSYTGKVARYLRKGGGTIMDGQHPALVDAALFAQVQETLARRRFSYTPKRPYGQLPYPLTGVAHCSYCAAPLLGLQAGGRLRYMRCSTAQRQGKGACQQPMVRAETFEEQIAAYVSMMRLPPEYVGAVVAELRRRREAPPADADTARRLSGELGRLKKLFQWGEIDDAHYRRESASLRRHLAQVQRPSEVLDVERAVRYLTDVGALWATSPREIQRQYVRTVFQRIVVEGPQVLSITPKPEYAPFFVLDRHERFGGEPWASPIAVAPAMFRLAPRAGDLAAVLNTANQYSPVLNPKTGLYFVVPELLVAA